MVSPSVSRAYRYLAIVDIAGNNCTRSIFHHFSLICSKTQCFCSREQRCWIFRFCLVSSREIHLNSFWFYHVTSANGNYQLLPLTVWYSSDSTSVRILLFFMCAAVCSCVCSWKIHNQLFGIFGTIALWFVFLQ